jgi:hypothetical protein
MGPLAYRMGFRGGPQRDPKEPSQGAFQVAEQVAVGAMAVLAARGGPITQGEQLRLAGPVHKQVMALVRRGAALTALELCAMAALLTMAALGAEPSPADTLCALLNRAASDTVAATWAVAELEQALAQLARVALPDGGVVHVAERVGARWRSG